MTPVNTYTRASKSFRTGRLERELQMIQVSATRCSCISILWASVVSFAAIALCVSSQVAFIVLISSSTQSGNFWIHPRKGTKNLWISFRIIHTHTHTHTHQYRLQYFLCAVYNVWGNNRWMAVLTSEHRCCSDFFAGRTLLTVLWIVEKDPACAS
jgi:hypothetical protein